MTNEELCALARSGNANAERELIGKLLPPLQAHAAKYETQYSGIPIEAPYVVDPPPHIIVPLTF